MIKGTSIIEEPSNPDEETMVSKERFSELLLKLERGLKELKKELKEEGEAAILKQEAKKENNQNLAESELVESKKETKKTAEEDEKEGNKGDFLEDHLNELEKLKKISTLSMIKISHIEWFFNTALFNLLNELPECFDLQSEEIYQLMLAQFKIISKKDFHGHLSVLLDQKTNEKEFPFVRFFPILSAAKNRENSVLDGGIFPETRRTKLPPSPLSLENKSISFKP